MMSTNKGCNINTTKKKRKKGQEYQKKELHTRACGTRRAGFINIHQPLGKCFRVSKSESKSSCISNLMDRFSNYSYIRYCRIQECYKVDHWEGQIHRNQLYLIFC